jgi:hypothetical protein
MSEPNRGAEPNFREFAEQCPCRQVLRLERRPANALCVEIGQGLDRCTNKRPSHWPSGASALRWLASGGGAEVFGPCSNDCPLLTKL